jgi:hypothetical protein
MLLATSRQAFAWTAAEGADAFAQLEARWKAATSVAQRNLRTLAELDASAADLATRAANGLRQMRESAAERDADMATVIASSEWRDTEALVAKLRFRIAWIKLERALAGDPAKRELAKAASDGFTVFVEAPDPELAAESRYGRGLARVAAGDRDGGLADLRAAAENQSVKPRAELAIAETLADGGRQDEALAMLARSGLSGLPPDLAHRAELLRLRLLVARAGRSRGAQSEKAGAPGGGATADAEISRLAAVLVKAGSPWREAAIAVLAGHEDRLADSPEIGPVLLRLKADSLARSGDASAALTAYRAVLATPEGRDDAAAHEGLARAAVALGQWPQATEAIAWLRAHQGGNPRELARLELRAAYGAWHAAPSAETAAALAAGVAQVRGTAGASRDDLSEAAFRSAELDRASGKLDEALAELAKIDAEAWRPPAALAILQCRFLRHEREPAREPLVPLARDLDTFIVKPGASDEARAPAVVLAGALAAETASAVDGPGSASLERRDLDTALARLREFPARYPKAASLLPAALRARARLEAALDEQVDVSLLKSLPEGERAAVATQIVSDLRADTARLADAGEGNRPRAIRCLRHAVAFAAIAPAGGDDGDQAELAQRALDLGESALALELYRKQAAAHPGSVGALRGLALAAEASGDSRAAREAWQKIAALPDLPEVLRKEAASHL